MKKVLVIFLVIFSQIAWSQTVQDVFSFKNITFYGFDFSNSKCIGMEDFPGAQEMITTYIPNWNYNWMLSKRKVKIGIPYKKKKVEYDTLVYARNRSIQPDDFIVNESHSFKKSQIQGFIDDYANKEKYGIGLVYLVESLNAKDEYASIWITFFDLASGKVLLTEPTRAEGKGKEFEEYWMTAFLKIYDNSADEYKTWEKLYN